MHGWGGPGRVVYQKASVENREIFCMKAVLDGIKAAQPHYKSLQHSAVNSKGEFETSSKTKATAVSLVPRHSERRQHLLLADRKVAERNAG